MSDDQLKRRKQMLYRANHRGIKEMDIILGGYASAHIMDMPVNQLGEFERILSELDRDLLMWFTGEEQVPQNLASPLFDAILRHTAKAE